MVTSLSFEVNLGKSFHYGNLDNNLTYLQTSHIIFFLFSVKQHLETVFRITALLRFI